MIVLGISETHCATAAILRDGAVVGCASEERFTRLKNDAGYPRLAVDALLRELGLKPQQIDLVALARALQELSGPGQRSLLALQLANNETGVLQPLREAAALARAHGFFIHADAVQAPGRIAIDLGGLGVDSLSLSAHKLGGPKGVGALVLRGAFAPDPLVRGGGQERRRRAGTENVAGIAGFGAAAVAAPG